ncbi:MAG TPA: DUF917 domain-containing protein [Gryllotalpicola sp.]
MGASVRAPLSELRGSDVDALASGAAILGCGGGGDVGLLLPALRMRGPDFAIPLEPLDGGLRFFTAVTFLGSTTVLAEKPPGGTELPSAVSAVERWTGRAAQAVVPAQIGGLTALGAALLADASGLPLLDADLVGRATPRLDQLSIFARQKPELTAAIITSSGLTVVVDARSPAELESALRGAVANTGGWAAFALGPLPLAQLREDMIAGSVSRALAIGRVAEAAGAPLADAVRVVGGAVVARGRVLDVERHGDPLSFVHGTASLADAESGAVARLEMGSEYHYLVVDGEPAASVPDIISVLDARTRAPISTDELRPGTDVAVLVLPAAPLWHSDDAFLRRADPRFYGIDADPVPWAAS